MADIIISAKSGHDWTWNELTAFNICVVEQNLADFFGVDQLPAPNVPASILTTVTWKESNDQETRQFFGYMDDAMSGMTESAVGNFGVALLRLLGYNSADSWIRFNTALSFVMCGSKCSAQTDVCVMDINHILLVVQEDKRSQEYPIGQLVAEAVAAFSVNNEMRINLSQDPLSAGIIPGIILTRTSPRFYKIHVTQDLVDCIQQGKHPNVVTNVFEYTPEFPGGLEAGMVNLDNRLVILSCYEAFKTIVFPPPP